MKLSSQLNKKNQQGAILVVALLFLLIMTILGLSGISSSFMEEKMVGNSISRERAFQASEAALRSAELFLAAAGNKDIVIAEVCGRVGNDSDPCDRAYDDSGNQIKTVGDDRGDTCPNGYCTPSEQDAAYDADAAHDCNDAAYIPERWQSCPTGTAAAGSNLSLFTTAGSYQIYPNPNQLGNIAQEPRYIIEFIGYRIPDGELSACDTDSDGFNDNPTDSAYWPFCTNDTAYFRITAMGYGGSVQTRVMLQSTVLVD
jgi:Tfp pilus assembly protein PilX